MCLLSEQREQTVKALNIKDMLLEKGKCTSFVMRSINTTKPGFHQSPIAFSEYPSNRKIFVVKLPITEKLQKTYESLINLLLATRNHIRQSPQARLAGGAKSYFGKQELILKSIRHTQQDQPPQLRQKLRNYH